MLYEETAQRVGNHSPYCISKKPQLHKLAEDYADKNAQPKKTAGLEKLVLKVEKQMSNMCKVFDESNSQCLTQSRTQIYYLFVRHVLLNYGHDNLLTLLNKFIAEFEKEYQAAKEARIEWQKGGRESITPGNWQQAMFLLERYQSQNNDKKSQERQVDIITSFFLRDNQDVGILDDKRKFSLAERRVIYDISQGKCQECGKSIDFKEFEADHIKQWIFGGATTIANARALCKKCNTASARKRK